MQLEFLPEDIAAVCRPGSADAAVAALVATPRIKTQLDALNPDRVMAVLAEYGAWDDDDLADHARNLHRLVWIACCDCNDED
jgi:predicted metallopeptidase